MGYLILFLLIAEQVSYFALGPYICRYGFCVAIIPISGDKISSVYAGKGKTLFGLKAKIDEQRNEIYFRKVYPAIVWGPHLFVGQVQKEKPTQLKVRIGIFTSAIIVLILIGSSFKPEFSFYDLMNTICLVGFILVNLIWFRRSIFKNLAI